MLFAPANMLNSIYNAICGPTYSHPVTQNLPYNNTGTHDQFLLNSSHATSNGRYLQSQQILLELQKSLSNSYCRTKSFPETSISNRNLK